MGRFETDGVSAELVEVYAMRPGLRMRVARVSDLGASKVKAEDQGKKWEWAPEAQAGGIYVRQERSAEPSPASQPILA